MKMKVLSMFGLCCLLLAGCARFIVPEIGSVAEEKSRIVYDVDEKQEGVLSTKDLHLEYSLVENDNGVRFTGELAFDRSLTNSFPGMKTFFLKLNWLDASGNVLKTVDISPQFSYLSYAPDKLKINKTIESAPGSSFICFNYYGVFQGEKPDVSEEWDILLFPFTAP
ncbi:MAG: hypothetical protein ACI8ZB_003186 [Desulforhopalus sp.]|jgi:hypothetical protein